MQLCKPGLQGSAWFDKRRDRLPRHARIQVSYRVNAVDHEAVAFGIYAARRSIPERTCSIKAVAVQLDVEHAQSQCVPLSKRQSC